jgi:hypothetical protein
VTLSVFFLCGVEGNMTLDSAFLPSGVPKPPMDRIEEVEACASTVLLGF